MGAEIFERLFEDGRVLAEVRGLSEAAAKVAAAPLWSLPDNEITDLLVAARQLEQAATTLQARLIHQADTRGLPAEDGHRSTSGWLRGRFRLDPQPARELAEQATAVGSRPELEEAVLDGRIDLRQAAVIAETLKAIPAGLSDVGEVSLADVSRLTAEAQDAMIELADRLPAFELRKVGDRILTHVAPGLSERAEEEALRRQRARAHVRRRFTLSLPVNGLVRLSGVLDAESAAIVQAALHPLCQPIAGDERTAEQRRADALTDVCRLALRTGELPEDGGEPPQVAVTVPFDPITKTLGTGTTDTGQRLSAEDVRRLACDARLLPVVLGGAGQVLDVGRTRRLATGPLRRALSIRDRGCAFPDCDRPPRWTDAHHVISWIDGGETRLGNLVLLCRHHHRLIHSPDGGWRIRIGEDGIPDFIPPPEADPSGLPRRNLYHRRE